MSDNLLPCPFCGGEADATAGEEYDYGWVFCKGCNAFGPNAPMDQVAAAWNTRAPSDAKSGPRFGRNASWDE